MNIQDRRIKITHFEVVAEDEGGREVEMHGTVTRTLDRPTGKALWHGRYWQSKTDLSAEYEHLHGYNLQWDDDFQETFLPDLEEAMTAQGYQVK